MPAVPEAVVPLEHPERGSVGTLVLRVPPRRDHDTDPPPLRDEGESPGRDASLPPVQLLEGAEYLYEVTLREEPGGPLTMEPVEHFDPDTEEELSGRLRPGLHTGLLRLRVTTRGRLVGRARVEVRSSKLRYRDHYRWMLGDLARDLSELVMQRFAPSRQRFEIDVTAGARTLYQRFAFLQSLLESEVFDGAIQQVLRRPYRTWTEEEERRPPGRGAPAGSGVARQLAGPGPRTRAGRLEEALGMETVPRTLRVERTEETRDNVPNRFVRFAFERWRDVVTQIRELLARERTSGPVDRGLRECRALLDRLDAVLARELFRSCGRLQSFPASNQVLHKREGYRDVFRAYIQFEAAAQLTWQGGEDVYGAGQRDVATLYEYWVFYALGREISALCDEPFAFADLIEPSDGGMTLRLRRDRSRVLSGVVHRLGRDLDVDLWFNRTFSRWSDRWESWTTRMRPDLSLRIRPSDPDAAFFHDEVWLHFDAKYRLDRLEDALGEDDTGEAAEDDVSAGEADGDADDGDVVAADAGAGPEDGDEGRAEAKRSDLLRMHAYRDAIRRSSGAYVVYPGTDPGGYEKYHEILPGLGAFPLRPASPSGGPPEGASDVRTFIDEVLDQVALQTSQHERARYWTDRSYRAGAVPGAETRAAPFLEKPPADTPVLLGYVRSDAQHRWIHHTRLYNVRGDDRTGSVDVDSEELGTRYVVLYGRGCPRPEVWEIEGEARLLDREDMLRSGYPGPGGELYFCLPLGTRRAYPPLEEVGSDALAELHRGRGGHPPGAPMVLSWRELVEGVSDWGG